MNTENVTPLYIIDAIDLLSDAVQSIAAVETALMGLAYMGEEPALSKAGATGLYRVLHDGLEKVDEATHLLESQESRED